MKLNLGCGRSKLEGYVNVDMFAECEPDFLWDLEKFPWPWETSSATEVLFFHSLEHIGAVPSVFLEIMKELYRISANGCIVKIRVPHPRHDNFINDPTHVRAITPGMLQLFSKRWNQIYKEKQAANTPLAVYLDVDFDLIEMTKIIDEPYLSQFQTKQITEAELLTLEKERNNIASEYRMTLRVIK